MLQKKYPALIEDNFASISEKAQLINTKGAKRKSKARWKKLLRKQIAAVNQVFRENPICVFCITFREDNEAKLVETALLHKFKFKFNQDNHGTQVVKTKLKFD